MGIQSYVHTFLKCALTAMLLFSGTAMIFSGTGLHPMPRARDRAMIRDAMPTMVAVRTFSRHNLLNRVRPFTFYRFTTVRTQ